MYLHLLEWTIITISGKFTCLNCLWHPTAGSLSLPSLEHHRLIQLVGLSTAKAESNDVYACGDTSPKADDDIYSGDELLNTIYRLGHQPAATSAPLFLALRFKFFHENFLEGYRESVLGQSSFQTVLPVKCFVQFPFIWTYGICRGEDLAGCSC